MQLVIANLGLILGGGFVIGFLIGITGVGAGSLTTPLLISGVGVPPAIAVGTDLLFAALTKLSAAWRHQRLGNVEWSILGWLALGSLPSALLVLIGLYIVDPQTGLVSYYIKKGLAISLIISSIAILLHPTLRRPPSQNNNDESLNFHARPLGTVLCGMLIGFAVALTSVGAGAIGVAILTGLYPLMIVRKVVGTDIVHAIPLTLVSGLGHASMGNIDPILLVGLLSGSIPGILIGSRLTGTLPDWVLRVTLAVVLIYAAFRLLNA